MVSVNFNFNSHFSAFRCHSFKKKIEKSDLELRKYVESITIIVNKADTSQEKQLLQQQEQIQHQIHHHQQQQQARPEHQPIIITNVGQPSLLNNGQQLFHSANGQIIGQFNNAVMIAAPVATQQLLTLPDVNRCELLTADQQFFEEIPIVIQSNNGQQTILNLPHSQVQTLHNQQQQQMMQQTPQHTQIQQVQVCEESDEAELQEEYEYEEVDEQMDNMEETQTYIVENVEEAQEETILMETSESVEEEERRVIEEFIQNQQSSGEPGKYTCSLCAQ